MPHTGRLLLTTVLTFILWALPTGRSSANPANPITLSISPIFGFAPMTARVKITIPQWYENRELCVGYYNTDSGLESSSCRPLNGEYEARTFSFEWKALPMGKYTAVAVLYRAGGNGIKTPAISFEVLESVPRSR